MTETYQSIGSASSPAIAAVGGVFLIVDLFMIRFSKIDRKRLYPSLFLGPLYILCGLLEIPVVFLFALTFLIVPSLTLYFNPTKTLAKILSIGFFLILTGFMALMVSDKRIVLSDRGFQSEQTGLTKMSGYDFDKASFPRTGLKVSAFIFMKHQSRWFSFRPRWGWDIYSGDKRGPYFSGKDYFWGPRGLVRGDTLGKHIAEWSGTEPTYKRYN